MTKEIQKYLELYIQEKRIPGIFFVVNKIYYTEEFVKWLIKNIDIDD
jgi:hypothetical protein